MIAKITTIEASKSLSSYFTSTKLIWSYRFYLIDVPEIRLAFILFFMNNSTTINYYKINDW